MIVLEPSCASVFRDELNELMPDNPLAKKMGVRNIADWLRVSLTASDINRRS